jgi:hypothetical protein
VAAVTSAARWANHCHVKDAEDQAVKLFLLVLIASILAIAAGLLALMVRRDEPILGLAALTAALCAAFVAVAYSGSSDL